MSITREWGILSNRLFHPELLLYRTYYFFLSIFFFYETLFSVLNDLMLFVCGRQIFLFRTH